MKTGKRLENLGFKMDSNTYGTIGAEPYDVGKNHFTPKYRSVYVSGRMSAGGGFYYVTSSIQGTMRRYRCRTSYECEIVNIFASGKTQSEAITRFTENFKAKTYNVTN